MNNSKTHSKTQSHFYHIVVFLMDVYVICLDKTFDTRCKPTLDSWDVIRNAAREELQMDVAVHRVAAVTPADFDQEDVIHPYTRDCIMNKHRNTTDILGSQVEAACFLSHLKCWELIQQSGRMGIVVEDDGWRNKKTGLQRLQQVQGRPADTDIFLCEHAPVKFVYKQHKHSHYRQVNKFVGCMFYAMTPQCASKVIEHALPLSVNVDTYLSSCIGPLGLKVYSRKGNHLPVLDFFVQNTKSTLGKGHYTSALLNLSIASVVVLCLLLVFVGLYARLRLQQR